MNSNSCNTQVTPIFRALLCILLLLHSSTSLTAQERIRFVTYNVENLFDCSDDSLTNDEAFLPTSLRRWSKYRYWNKLHAISRAIATIGGDRAPDLVALCEVENDSVLHDLTRRSPLRTVHYDYLMTSSRDPRGIDVALLYKPTVFSPFAHRSLRLPARHIPEGSYVRDILCVSGTLIMGDTLDLIVCHLPSRLNGRKAARLRHNVVKYMQQAIDSITTIRAVPRIIVMGDFNDTPHSRTLRPLTENGRLTCITDTLSGSYRYKGHWQQIDHIYLSPALLDSRHTLHLSPHGAWIPYDATLMEPEPLYGGYRPHRTYNGLHYEGGTSDHLPVCSDLEFSW